MYIGRQVAQPDRIVFAIAHMEELIDSTIPPCLARLIKDRTEETYVLSTIKVFKLFVTQLPLAPLIGKMLAQVLCAQKP